MSYDYLMFKKPVLLPKWIGRARALLGTHDSIGTVEELKKTLSELVPHISWREQKITGVRMPIPIKDDAAWFSGPHPEFQISAGLDGSVTNFNMARAEPNEIRLVEKKLGVVAVDLQRDGILGMIFS